MPIILAFCLFLVGCEETPNITEKYPYRGPTSSYSVVRIDGCEYVLWCRELTHKGNCTNSCHVYRYEK